MTSLLLLATLLADPPPVATTPHLPPAEERAKFKVPDGFEVQLVAAEPDIAKPINMAFDARGRLWVTCTVEYPYEAPEGKGRDTVKILSDFGPDGRARNVNTFAEGLNIPIGILPYQDGCIVYSIPNIWMLRDTDGDGKCDKREVLYSGFGHRDTHGMVNGFFHGFDGWVYACHGYLNDSMVKGKDGHEITMNSGNVFRFRPDGSRVELFAKGQVNPFGSCMDKWGNLYTACCHSKPITLVLRGACYESFGKPHDGLGYGPAMVHQYRGSTALCGLAWYEADHFPKPYQECFYLGDVVNNCVNRFTMSWKGATPTAKQAEDFLTSSDPWFRPCDIKLGPDGALYVADFYNRIIGHYEVPLGHPGRDRTSGRIWRIVRTDKKLGAIADRTKSSPEQLTDDLYSKNIALRFLAMHRLVEEGKPAVGALREFFDEPSQATARSAALWSLLRIIGPDDAASLIQKGLDERPRYGEEGARNAVLRAHCLRMPMPKRSIEFAARVIGALEMDTPTVKFAAAERAGIDADPFYGPNLCDACESTKDDAFLHHLVKIGLRNVMAEEQSELLVRKASEWDVVAEVAVGIAGPRGAELLQKYLESRQPPPALSPSQARHICRYMLWKEAKENEFLVLLETTRGDDITHQRSILKAVNEGFKLRGRNLPLTARCWAERVANTALRSKTPGDVIEGIEIAALIDDPGLNNITTAIAEDRERPANVRLAALPVAAASHAKDVGVILADATEAARIREQAAKALGVVNTDEARAALVNALPAASSRLAQAIATALAGAKRGAELLCDAVERGQASPRLLLDSSIRPKLDAAGLKDRVAKLTQGLPPADQQLEALIAKRRAGFAAAKPDVAAGKELFAKNCAVCHQVAGVGSKIGPQLDGIGTRGLDRLLEDVLDPSRNVDPAFRATTLQLTDGRTLSGLLLREEGATVVLADNEGKEVIVRKDQIEERSVSPLSAMPAKFGEQMPEADFHALMAYLLTLKKSQ
jgi:putative heme-binding domain-containing protein